MPKIFHSAAALAPKLLGKVGKTGTDTVAYLCSKFSTRILSLCLLPVWTSLLTPTQYGTLGTVTAWTAVLAPFILLGFPSVLLRFCPDQLCDDKERQVFLSTTWIMVAISGGIMLAATFAVGPALWVWITSGKIPFYPLVPMAVLGAVLTSTGKLVMAERLALRDTRNVIIIEQVTSTVTILAALFGVGVLGLGVVGYLSGGLFVSGLTTIFLFWVYSKKGFHWNSNTAKQCLIYGVPLVPQALAAWALNLSDRVIIEWYHPLSESGIYNLAANFGMIMSFLAVSISQATTPSVFAAMGEATLANRKQLRLMAVGTLGMISACAVGMMAVAPPLLSAVANVRYGAAIAFVIPVVAGYFLFGVYQMFLRPMLFHKRTKIVAMFSLLAALVNVVLNLIFVPSGGAMAAALTTAVSYAVAALCSWFVSVRLDKMELGSVSVLLLITIPVGCGFVLHWIPSDEWLAFFQRVGIGAVGVLVIAAVCFLQMRAPVKLAQPN